MKKRFAALFVCLCLIVGILAGCGGRNPKEEFINSFKKLAALREVAADGKFTVNVDPVKLMEALDYELTEEDDASPAKAEGGFTASASFANKQLAANVSGKLTSDTEDIRLNPENFLLFIDGDKLYLNHRAFFEFTAQMSGIEGYDYAEFFDKDFMQIDASAAGDIWQAPAEDGSLENEEAFKAFAEKCPKAGEAILKILSMAKTKLTAGAFSFNGDEVVLTVNNSLIFSILDGIINDMDTNRALYADAIIEVMWLSTENTLAAGGYSAEEIEEQHQVLLDSASDIAATIPYIKTAYNELDKASMPEFTFKLGITEKSADSFALTMTAGVGEIAALDANCSYSKAELTKKDAPENYMTQEELIPLRTPDGETSVMRKMFLKITDGDGNSKTMVIESDQPYFLDAVYDYNNKLITLDVDEYGQIYVSSVDGIKADPDNMEYWDLYVDGNLTTVYELSSHGGIYELMFVRF